MKRFIPQSNDILCRTFFIFLQREVTDYFNSVLGLFRGNFELDTELHSCVSFINWVFKKPEFYAAFQDA